MSDSDKIKEALSYIEEAITRERAELKEAREMGLSANDHGTGISSGYIIACQDIRHILMGEINDQ